jgi:hypothetical protein
MTPVTITNDAERDAAEAEQRRLKGCRDLAFYGTSPRRFTLEDRMQLRAISMALAIDDARKRRERKAR